ncbi:MAG: hypothetical protein V4696_12780 [Pseudomonadota bacterium]
MGNVNYDWLKGMQRVMRAEVKLDERWVEVIALHAALEAEINAMLILSLPQGEFVTGNKPKITFGHKVAILKAAWKGKPEDADKIADILLSFNELRNAVAHPDLKKTKAEIANTVNAYRVLVPNLPYEPDIAEIAQGVVAFMGDGILPHDLVAITGQLAKLVNVDFPKAFGVKSVLDDAS